MHRQAKCEGADIGLADAESKHAWALRLCAGTKCEQASALRWRTVAKIEQVDTLIMHTGTKSKRMQEASRRVL